MPARGEGMSKIARIHRVVTFLRDSGGQPVDPGQPLRRRMPDPRSLIDGSMLTEGQMSGPLTSDHEQHQRDHRNT